MLPTLRENNVTKPVATEESYTLINGAVPYNIGLFVYNR